VIIAETEGAFRFVAQPDHADLSGQFADHWGNETFAEPAPEAATRIAAYHHDAGWVPYDRRPHLRDGEPIDFVDMAPDTWTDIYDRGIETVADLDPYASLLVSMHGTGLRRRRYGLSPSWSGTPAAFKPFVDRQEDRQADLAGGLRDAGRLPATDADLLSALHETGTPPKDAGSESRLWRNYALLQAWDTLSLAFCTTADPPGQREVGPVPVDGSSPDATLSIIPLGDGAFRVDPYPFDASPLSVSVPARTVPKDAFSPGGHPVEPYYRAERTTLEFTLRRGNG